MRIPKKFCTGTYTWIVKKATALFMDDGEKDGITDRSKLLVSVSTSSAQENIDETFNHELLHAIFYESGLRIDDELEERIILAISPVMTRTLKNNKIY